MHGEINIIEELMFLKESNGSHLPIALTYPITVTLFCFDFLSYILI